MLVNDGKIYVGETPITKVYQGIDVIYEQGRKPKELLYLQSTGTQYIDTGISPTVNHEIELDFQLTNATETTGTRLFGSRKTWNQQGFYGGTSSNLVGRNWWLELGNQYKEISLASDKNRHIIKFGKNVYVDKTYYYTFTSAFFDAYANIMLFGSFDGDTSTTQVSKTAYKLYSCKIYNNGVLVRDFIPMLDENDVACLYDKVSKAYFYNAGTGDFLYEEKPEYTELSYLQSSGTQYIDTGYSPKGNAKYELSISDGTTAGVVFGAYDGAWTSGNGFYHNASSNSYEWLHYLSNTQLSFKSKTSGVEEIIINKGQAYINGSSAGSAGSEKTFTVPYTMYIFGGNWSGTLTQPMSTKLHYFKISENDILVHDYIPVLDPQGIPSLYDKVTQTYLYNQGTGEFSFIDPRPEPPPQPVPMPTGYTQLKNIIAHGHQRINTGIIPNDNTYGFEAKFCLENGEGEGLWDWNIMNMGGNSVDNYRFGFGGWKALGGDTSTPNLQPAGIRVQNGSRSISNPKISYGTNYKVLFNYNNDRVCYLDGVSIASGFTNGTYTYSDPWNIFCQTYNNGSTQYARFFWGKLYYLKIWLGETLVRDFVPALDNNNVPCLYDTVTQQTFYNSGSGNLTYETLE